VLRSRHWILAAAIAAVATIQTGSLQAQAAATICKDGTRSVSSGRGACSGHGGVNTKAATHQKKVVKSEVKAATVVAKGAEATSRVTGAPVRAPGTAAPPRASARARVRANSNSAVVSGSGAAEDNNPAGAIARCKDGLYSHARNRRGACSRHRGVASWL
jgi:hypothetical protein